MFLDKSQLEAGIHEIRLSPKDNGIVEHIVCRPDVNQRQEMVEAELDVELGLVGDNWYTRGDGKEKDGVSNLDMQLNLMNARAIALIAQTRDRWKLAGDQLFVDLDLSYENLPPGTELHIGDAVIQVTAEPHLGCSKFMERFGRPAAIFVNSEVGKSLNLRGINARVVVPGKVKLGDRVIKKQR